MTESNSTPLTWRTFFGFREAIPRKLYIITGFILALLKYGMDVAVAWFGAGVFWTPTHYLNPMWSMREGVLRTDLLSNTSTILLTAMALYTLPFLWIGLSMSIRRAYHAGISPWIGALFLVPGFNWLVIIGLCIINRGPPQEHTQMDVVPTPIVVALAAIGLGILQSLGMIALNVYVFRQYGTALFFLTPAFVGIFAGYLLNRKQLVSVASTLGTSVATVLLSSLGLLLFAMEGVICIAMAMPLAIMIVAIGALCGRAIAQKMLTRSGDKRPPNQLYPMLFLAALPLLSGAEAMIPKTNTLYEVRTEVIIDAPVERVWKEVVYFSELPEPPQWVKTIGIAYPIRAKLVGQGVGAVRYCEFSTGPFVEPITVWEPNKLLAFSVRSQPMPMHEWSPYNSVHPPHLDNYWRSKKGQFKFTQLPDGRTKLEGSTWYELDMQPVLYWRVITNSVIHNIHLRVLDHVKSESEKPPAA